MHELSIALSMIEMATGEAEKRGGARIGALHLKLGVLSGVVKDALLFSWEIACAGTLLEGARLEIEEIPLVVFCANCRATKTLDSINSFLCPSCNLPTPEVVEGRELQVTALEILSELPAVAGAG
jgi:hydrogenase nickel incorporation protein HypA/HybF